MLQNFKSINPNPSFILQILRSLHPHTSHIIQNLFVCLLRELPTQETNIKNGFSLL